MLEEKTYTVSEVTDLIKDLIEDAFNWVSIRGEISSLDRSQRGHYYFTLKDEKAQIRAVLYKGRARWFVSVLATGNEVICSGPIEVYRQRGEYRIVVEYMERVGVGALYREFERLKKLLEKEGLFDEKYKRPIPLLPKRIGIVTSPEGAAIRDIIKIIRESGYNFHIIIYPSHVQGKGAAKELVEGIRFFNQNPLVDLIIVARGGGSIEDLWAFNEEALAREIFNSSIPVISAVGHERDWTISDFVADKRCATPSHAAGFLVENERKLRKRVEDAKGVFMKFILNKLSHSKKDLTILKKRLELRDPRRVVREGLQRLDELAYRMHVAVSNLIEGYRKRVGMLHRVLSAKNPVFELQVKRQRLISLKDRLVALGRGDLEERRKRLDFLGSKLDTLSPRSVLSRGYAICYHQGRVLKDANLVDVNDLIFVELASGALECRIKRKMPLYRSC